MNRLAFPALAALLTSAACEGRGDEALTTEEPAAAPVEVAADSLPHGLSTESVTYRVRTDGVTERIDIPWAYRNVSADTLYHPTCRAGGRPGIAMGVQREGDRGWETVWSPVLPQCLSEPVIVAPGETVFDTLRVVLHPQDTVRSGTLTPRSDLEGSRYRLVWTSLLRTYDADRYPFGEEIDLDRRVSEPFGLSR